MSAPLPQPQIPPPPEDPEALAAWADAHKVSDRLDDIIVGGHGPAGSSLPGRPGESLSFRQILLEGQLVAGRRRPHDAAETARGFLHRLATLLAQQQSTRAFLDAHGETPEDTVLASFLGKLRAERVALRRAGAAQRPVGTYEPVQVRALREPVPMLRYEEASLTGPRPSGANAVDVVLPLLGWNEGPLRWLGYRGDRPLPGEVSPELQLGALDAMINLICDPRAPGEHEMLSELLRLPAWQFALGALDERLAHLEDRAAGPATTEERVAFRIQIATEGAANVGAVNVEPVVQRRARGGLYSKGARLPWFELPERRDLSAADRRAFAAYDDRFARRSNTWGGALTPAQAFGILRALIDHPAVFLEGDREGAGRLDLRLGRLCLRFASSPGGHLSPLFSLGGLDLLAPEVAAALRDDRHLIHLHRPQAGAPQLLLAELSPAAAAVVQALAVAPATFPPEAHDALAVRLENLQESVDIEFPSPWTRTIAAADGRLVARLELLASGALRVRLGVRPVHLGPVFLPGEGPALVLEGQGRDRHGARRDRQAERQAAHALAEALGLAATAEAEPWCFRASPGDAALGVVEALSTRREQVLVEWADDAALIARGTVSRGQMRLRVGDRRDWFTVEGGAEVAGDVVPLFELLAAIREGRRYVAVGARGFARIEESLREALARAEAVGVLEAETFALPSLASDPLVGLIEEDAQLEASDAFRQVRRRMREGTAIEPQLPAALAEALRPYQKAGVTWLCRLAHWGAGAVLADEMGLGKTIQTLGVLAHRAALGPALVVAPTSVVANWQDEAARFAPDLRVLLFRGPGRAAVLQGLGPGDLVVTSYGLATMDAELLGKTRFASLVLDEAHAVKNATTERAKALRDLDAAWRLGLTGTPIENHVSEVWGLLRVISPGLLGSWEQFRGRYAVPIEKFGDEGRRAKLALVLRPFVLRRTKAEVARELPPRTEVVRTVRLSPEEMSLYHQMRASTLEELAARKKDRDRGAEDMRFELLAAITRMRQLCCHPRLVYPRSTAGSAKAGYLIDLLGELRQGDHKALVFSQFRSFLELLAPRLRQAGFRVLSLDGTTPPEVRTQRIAAFQAGAADVFLISLKAGGVGLNLTAADTVIHLDPWWNPAVEDQATARAHRIGQEKPVTAVRLVARDTIEEAVLELHGVKRRLAAGLLAESDLAASLPPAELLRLIERGSGPA